MSDSKDRSGAPPDKTFDQAWGSLSEDEASEGGTKAWTEEARGAAKRGVETPPPEEPVARNEKTMAWTEDVRAERKRDAPEEDEMDRLMRAELDADAPAEEEIAASASTSAMTFEALDLPERAKPDASLMDALMGDTPGTSSSEDVAEEPTSPEGDEPKPKLKLVEEDAGDGEEPPAPIMLFPEHAKPTVHKKRKAKKPKPRLPLFVGGAVAAGLAFWFARTPEPKPETSTAAVPAEVVTPDVGSNAEPEVEAADAAPDAGASAPVHEPPPKPDPNRDPREPPAGTPPEIAAVFKKLPVSPADRAPVGGVGRSGVHVDDVAVGSGYERSRCTGGDGPFSVAEVDRANVCLRVVHQRQKEDLSVVWQKRGGHARRGKIVVKPMHAYRTRAYLKLRSEYVGDWEVKIFSDDGVELARYPFTVVP
jgi:hypothetical protein